MTEITLNAYAKINLGLDVLRKRPDGYHDLRMIMQSISLHDTLTLRKTEQDAIRLFNTDGTENPDVPMDDSNLIYKAIQSLRQEFHITEGVDVILDKQIPVAAGMAGGSTDGAAAYKAMNQLFELGLTEQQLRERAVKLGADIPYCIMGGTALSEGIGEVLTPLAPMPKCAILIAKPDINVSTGFVYGNLRANELSSHPDIDGMVQAIQADDLSGVTNRLGNVLETVTIPAYPVIEKIKQAMIEDGAEGSLMSGSGPTVFGIFREEEQAQKAAEKLCNTSLAKYIFVVEPVQNQEV